MDFRGINKIQKNILSWPKFSKTLKGIEMLSGCGEFNALEVKLAVNPARPPADIWERPIWQRGQPAKMKKTNVSVRAPIIPRRARRGR